MFIRTLKVTNRQSKTQYPSENPLSKSQFNSTKRHTLQNYHDFTQLGNVSTIKLTSDQPSIYIKSPNKDKRLKLITFQNEYIKKLTHKQPILDERKLLIKQKIKGKVKQQLADLLRRSNLVYSSLAQINNKDQVMSKSVLEVEVKGNSVKKSLRNSLTHRPQLVKLQKIRRINKKSVFVLKQTPFADKILTTDSSPRQKTKSRRSLSNVIRLHNLSPSKLTRNIRSALDTSGVHEKKNSLEIQPWEYAEDC